MEENPDVAAAGINPLTHYLAKGAAEGRNPNPHFHTSYYLQTNPDVALSGLNPLVHYITYGIAQKRKACPADYQMLIDDILETASKKLFADLFSSRSGRKPISHLVILPVLASSEDELAAINYARFIVQSLGSDDVALVIADTNDASASTWPLQEIALIKLGAYGRGLSKTQRQEMLYALIRFIRPQTIYNINSEAGREVFIKYGEFIKKNSKYVSAGSFPALLETFCGSNAEH